MDATARPSDSLLDSLATARRRVRRVLRRRRRLLAALLTAAAVLVGLQAAAPATAPGTPVLVAADDLPAGTVLAPHHLAWTEFTPDSVPAGVVRHVADAVGRTATGPVRAGEPITDVRLLAGSLLAGHAGRVAVPVRIGDPGAVELLRVGDTVDVLAAGGEGPAVTVARDAAVLALPRARETLTASGGLVVLAVPEDTARDLAGAGVDGYLSVVLTH
jgi:Flp pilus assembly protein CpaB